MQGSREVKSLDALDCLEPRESRHVMIDQDQMDFIPLDDLHRLLTVGRQQRVVTPTSGRPHEASPAGHGRHQ